MTDNSVAVVSLPQKAVQSFATIPVPMTSQALTLYRILIEMGHSELDTSSILKVIQR